MRDPKGQPRPHPPQGSAPPQVEPIDAQFHAERGSIAPGRLAAARPVQMEGSKSSVGPLSAPHMRGVGGIAARAARAVQASGNTRVGRSPAGVVAALGRAQALVDMRLVSLLTQDMQALDAAAQRLEVALLAAMHRTLAAQAGQVQDDAVLMDSLADYADAAGHTLADLEAGGTRSLERWIDFLAERIVLGEGNQADREAVRALRRDRNLWHPAEPQDGGTASEPVSDAALQTLRHKVIALYMHLATPQANAAANRPRSLLEHVLQLPVG